MQAQAVGAHDAAMSAIRNGQFKLKAVKGPTQQTAPATDPRDALFSAIKNRQFTLKAVSPAEEQTAGKCIPRRSATCSRSAWCLPAWGVPTVDNLRCLGYCPCSLVCKDRTQANDMRACCPMQVLRAGAGQLERLQAT